MKKCLAYSEENRVSWPELFEMFLNKSEIKPLKVSEIERSLSTQALTKNGRTISQLITPKSNFNSISAESNPQTPTRVTSNKEIHAGSHNSSLSAENIKKDRDILVYKHYILQELVQFPKPLCFDSYKWDKLLFILAQSMKLRSTYMMSLMSLAAK